MFQFQRLFGRGRKGKRIRRAAASVICSAGALLALPGTLSTPAAAQTTVRKPADFDGDGYADIAIGAPGEGLWFSTTTGTNYIPGAGVVHVVFGSASGLIPAVRNQLLHRNNQSASFYPPTSSASFGQALAWADFNDDGYDDLAVGVPGDKGFIGSVDVYHGSANGLPFRPAKIWTVNQLPGGVPGMRSDQFGTALAAGDVDGDGFADLAISKLYGWEGRGALYILYGTAAGLTATSAQSYHYFSLYGPSSLAFGDFDRDGFADLAMGLPFEYSDGGSNGLAYSGAVFVEFGSPYGLDSSPRVWTQDSPYIPGIVEHHDYFGFSLAAADFNHDGFWDLAIGAPGENTFSGVVHILFGRVGGLHAWGTQIWSQDNPDVQDVVEANDRFGASLTAGKFNGDGYPELAVGAPGENRNSGVVHILTINSGPFGARHQIWSQDSPGVLGGSETGDHFGSFLAAGNFDSSGSDDLAIGVAGENTSSGAVNVLLGSLYGLGSANNHILMQGFQALPETPESFDLFGHL